MKIEIMEKLDEIFSTKTLKGRVQVVDMSELVDKQIVKESTNLMTDYAYDSEEVVNWMIDKISNYDKADTVSIVIFAYSSKDTKIDLNRVIQSAVYDEDLKKYLALFSQSAYVNDTYINMVICTSPYSAHMNVILELNGIHTQLGIDEYRKDCKSFEKMISECVDQLKHISVVFSPNEFIEFLETKGTQAPIYISRRELGRLHVSDNTVFKSMAYAYGISTGNFDNFGNIVSRAIFKEVFENYRICFSGSIADVMRVNKKVLELTDQTQKNLLEKFDPGYDADDEDDDW